MRQAALDRPERTRKLARCLFGREALEKAQDQDVAQLGRKFAQLGVEDRPDVEPIAVRVIRGGDVGRHRSQTPSPPGFLGSRLGCHAGRHAVQPGAQAFGIAKLPGLPDQHEERRLECIVGIVRVAQQAPADPQNHRSMPRDNRFERRFVAVGNETFQQRPSSDGSAPFWNNRPRSLNAKPLRIADIRSLPDLALRLHVILPLRVRLGP